MAFGKVLSDHQSTLVAKKQTVVELSQAYGTRAGEKIVLKSITFSLFGPVVDFSSEPSQIPKVTDRV